MKNTAIPQFNRRTFLKIGALTAAAGAAVGPTIIPSRVLGDNAPSKQVTFGFVAVGGMGLANLDRVLKLKDKGARAVAVCDVDSFHRAAAAKRTQKLYDEKDPIPAVNDFREITRKDGIDAIVVSTPDHWHTIPAIDAIRHGKDVYVEKPLTLTIREGQALVEALRKHERVGQTGTMQRSDKFFQFAAEMIRGGGLGKLSRIEVLIPANNKYVGLDWKPEPVPEGLDYDLWLGPAPFAPYTRQRTHYQFRFIADYAGGQTTNWGAHYIDIAQWALAADDSGPVEVEGSGEYPTSGLFTNATRVDFTVKYSNGVPMHVRTRTDGIMDGNVRFYGEKATLDVSRSKLTCTDPSLLPAEIVNGKRGDSGVTHMNNFLDCIRTRTRCVADIAIGHRTTTVCNIGNIAMLLRRKLQWDPVKEEFAGDLQANRMKERAFRGPWSLA